MFKKTKVRSILELLGKNLSAREVSDIITMFQPLIKKYAFLLGDMDAYADMYDSFIDCIYKIPIQELRSSSGDAVVLAYIKTTMKNSYIALSKRNSIRKSQIPLDDCDMENEKIGAVGIDFDSQVIREDLLRFLSTEEELLLEAKIFYGYSDAEIAKKLRISRQAVNKRYQKIIEKCRYILKEKMLKEQARGLKPRAIRAIVIGIPNVGKSTFINKLANRKATITGNRPGVTKSQQIIRVAKDFELFDTPGVLWPKFENIDIARNIALIGSIKQDILPLDELYIYAMQFLGENYPLLLKNRYQLDIHFEDDNWILHTFDHIAKIRKIKPLHGETDYDRVIELFFSEIYDGSLGQITWEDISCVKG